MYMYIQHVHTLRNQGEALLNYTRPLSAWSVTTTTTSRTVSITTNPNCYNYFHSIIYIPVTINCALIKLNKELLQFNTSTKSKEFILIKLQKI